MESMENAHPSTARVSHSSHRPDRRCYEQITLESKNGGLSGRKEDLRPPTLRLTYAPNGWPQ